MTVIISGTDGVSDVDGTAGTPALRGTDANTGIFFPAADTIAFAEGGAEAMRINSSGQVGIATTNPGRILDIVSTNSNPTRITGTSSNGAYLDFHNNAATTGRFRVGQGYGSGDDNISFFNNEANAAMVFGTNNAERARITSDDYFKASNDGTYLFASGFHELVQTANAETLIISGENASLTSNVANIVAHRNTTNNTFFALNYFNEGANAFKFRVADSGNVTNTNNSYGSISDVKLKQDIVDAGSQWDGIKGLRVRKYRWKSEPDGFMQMGVVAQEAELVSPGLIDEHPDYEEVEVTDEEGNVTTERQATGTVTKAVKYSVLYMKAVKALQEAIERIETLEAGNTALEARIAALEAQ